MITFAALTPHTPLLLPTIGKEHKEQLANSLRAFENLKKAFHDSAPDTTIIISPHSTAMPDAVTLNLTESYHGDLSEFGDLETKPTFKTDQALIDQIQRTLRKKQLPITLYSFETLDYGATVPLSLIKPKDDVKLVHIIPSSELDFKKTFAIGEAMKDILTNTTKRIAIIASNNLSHRLSSESPAGFSSQGEKFDATIKEALETKNTSRLISLSEELVREAGQCGFRGLLILMGIISRMQYEPRLLAYEHPFGVGYLTADFSFK